MWIPVFSLKSYAKCCFSESKLTVTICDKELSIVCVICVKHSHEQYFLISDDWSLTIDELIQFNTLPGAIDDLRQQDFKRYIVTKVLPRLRRTNIEGIAKLLHIGSETITDIVIPVLLEETIETELYCGNAEDFYQAFNAVIEVFTIANSPPNLLLILFNLVSIIRRKYNENQITQKTNMCKKCQKRYRSLRTSKVCHRLSALKLLTEQMQSSTKWEIPKSNAEGQSFPTTNFVDQYSYLFGILNKVRPSFFVLLCFVYTMLNFSLSNTRQLCFIAKKIVLFDFTLITYSIQ